MQFASSELIAARELDIQDPLARFREKFYIADENTIYLDGNSLGRLPLETMHIIDSTMREQWGTRLIRSWNEDWVRTSRNIGAKIARLIGAREDEVIVADSTSINLFKLAVAALRACEGRTKIVSDDLNFPSDLYILQGIIELLNGKHRLVRIPSADGMTIPHQSIQNHIDDDTALVCLTHVSFKYASMYDMAAVTELVHSAGALMLWDLSHSAGAVPLALSD